MLKAVENPTGSDLTQGVMVTPEGGYVVAQPDLQVPSYTNSSFIASKLAHLLEPRGKSKYHDQRASPQLMSARKYLPTLR